MRSVNSGLDIMSWKHFFVGGGDSFFLTNAVMDTEDFLATTSSPASDAEVVVGVHAGRGYEHCFRGYEYAPGVDPANPGPNDLPLPNSITRLTYNQAFLPRMAAHFVATAPLGADTESWRY